MSPKLPEALERWRARSPARRVLVSEDSIVLSEKRGARVITRKYPNEKAAVWAVMQGTSI